MLHLLGQSTKMTTQYAEYKNAKHYVIENDPTWINFFKRGNSLSENTQTKRKNSTIITALPK